METVDGHNRLDLNRNMEKHYHTGISLRTFQEMAGAFEKEKEST